jgi:hypothetical protein
MINIGLDFKTKNDRLAGTIEYYRKTATDLMGKAPLDPTLGVTLSNLGGTSYFFGNVASMKGRGVDVQLTSHNIDGTFKWSTDLLFSYTSGTVTKYLLPVSGGNAYLNPSVVNPVEGRPLFSLYSFAWAGLDPQTGAPRGYKDGKISDDYGGIYSNTPLDSMIFSGPSQPPYFGALRNTFSWKNISLSVNISYKLGYYFRRSSVNYSSLFSSWTGSGDYGQRWQRPGDELKTDVPALVYPADNYSDIFYGYSSVLVEKGDHIRLEDVMVSYEMDKHRFSFLPMRNMRFYVYAGNLGVLWKAGKKEKDPYYVDMPVPGRMIAFGITANF